jgi:hypothetical protein
MELNRKSYYKLLNQLPIVINSEFGMLQPFPSERPSGKPSRGPSGKPSRGPSGKPSRGPSGKPSGKPSGGPSGKPRPTKVYIFFYMIIHYLKGN